MTDHLSEQLIARYRERRVPFDELVRADDHLSECAECRNRLAQAHDLAASFTRADNGSLSTSIELREAHLTYEQLEGYVDGTLSLPDQKNVRAHIKLCQSCATELQDLESFRAELADSASERTSASRRPLPWLYIGLATAAVIVVVFVYQMRRSTTLPFQHAEGPEANANPSHKELSTPSASEIAALEPRDQQAVLEATKRNQLVFPVILKELQGNPQTLLSESPDSSAFAVLVPVGEVVLDTHPVFRWQPSPGAQTYSVAIFDAKLNPVQVSLNLRTTQWKPDQPLERGRIYQWQVTATMNDGASLISPKPPSPEAKFQVLDQSRADELERFRQSHPDAHLVLGILYAQSGLLQMGKSELEKIPQDAADYETARKFLKEIEKTDRRKP